jgi:hypothetical protein
MNDCRGLAGPHNHEDKTMTKTEDKLANARAQGQAQFDSIREMIDGLDGWIAAAEDAGWESYHDQFNVLCWRNKDGDTWAGTAQDLCLEHGIEPTDEMVEEDALSVQVRSGWHQPGDTEASKPEEYEILLCTGGPAVRIVGELDQHCQPETARLEVQDWFTPWAEMRPLVGPDNYDSEPILLAYASVFWFGE